MITEINKGLSACAKGQHYYVSDKDSDGKWLGTRTCVRKCGAQLGRGRIVKDVRKTPRRQLR